MKNYKTFTDSQLLEQIRIDAGNERKSGLAVIHQLREIAHRRLDATLGYSSLQNYCIEELGYSSGSAWRRVNAMKALGDLPEFEARIEQGTLTLANVSQVQSFCEQNHKTVEEKKEILAHVSGLSKREAQRQLAKIAPLPERPDKVRPLNENQSELRVTLTSETLAELEKIRDLLSHSHPGASLADVIAYLSKMGLKKLDPVQKKDGRISPPGEKTEAIPAATRRFVWRRDGGRCGYKCEATGRICGATAYLQIDHAIPRAKGGSHDPSNLRLRCRRHNLLAAVQEFGEGRMRPYLRN